MKGLIRYCWDDEKIVIVLMIIMMPTKNFPLQDVEAWRWLGVFIVDCVLGLGIGCIASAVQLNFTVDLFALVDKAHSILAKFIHLLIYTFSS